MPALRMEGEDGVMAEHNHVTRDIKPFGTCPGCDRYYACTCRNGPRVYPDAPPAHDVSCWYPRRMTAAPTGPEPRTDAAVGR